MVESESVSQTEKILKSVITSTDSLGISRIPSQLKADFIALAKEEFCNDYGMLLRHIWDQFVEYQRLKNQILEGEFRVVVCSAEKVEVAKAEGIKLLNGKIRKGVFGGE